MSSSTALQLAAAGASLRQLLVQMQASSAPAAPARGASVNIDFKLLLQQQAQQAQQQALKA